MINFASLYKYCDVVQLDNHSFDSVEENSILIHQDTDDKVAGIVWSSNRQMKAVLKVETPVLFVY